MKTRLIIIALAAAISLPAMAQSDDFGLWTSAGATKKINKQWSVGAEAEFRTRESFDNVDRWSGAVGATYKPVKWLKADVAYKLLYDHRAAKNTYHSNGLLNKHTPQYWQPRHRVAVSLTGTLPVGDFRLSLRERWQYTYRPEKTVQRWDDDDEEWSDKVVGAKGANVLRSRFQVEWKLPRTPFNPYANIELFNAWELRKTRYTVGTEVKLSKHHALDVFYRYQDVNSKDDDQQKNSHILGIGYEFKF